MKTYENRIVVSNPLDNSYLDDLPRSTGQCSAGAEYKQDEGLFRKSSCATFI